MTKTWPAKTKADRWSAGKFFAAYRTKFRNCRYNLVLPALAALLLWFTGCKSGNFEYPKQSSEAQPAKVILREGDTVEISFLGSPNLNTERQIQRDGQISLLLVGEVAAAGLTLEELHDKLVKLYESQISSKEITVVLKSSSFSVYVTGYVLRPGKITSSQPITALEAVMEVGVDYATANLRAVRVIRRQNGVAHNYELNLRDILDGKDTPPFYLQPEDVVYVPQKFSVL